MEITGLTHDNYSYTGAEGTMRSTKAEGGFDKALSTESDKKCPYSFLAKDGIIQYNGVVFECDYKKNAITLGNMYEKEKVLKIALPSGGSLHVNVDNIGQLSKAVGMFTPEDLNAIMRAIYEYNHCTRKRLEIEEEKAETAEEAASEAETADGEKELAVEESSFDQEINAYRSELYYKLIHNETEVKIRIGNQEFSEKEWDKLIEGIDEAQKQVQEALDEKKEKQEEEALEKRIDKLFEEREELLEKDA